MTEFTVAPASTDDMSLVAGWAAAEGWNPGIGDETAFYATDPTGFLVGRLDGRPVTSISAVRYGAGHGFVGLYLTDPEHRGRGLGMRTWQAGLARLRGRAIGLDGVAAQQDNYGKSGFRPAWRTVRYEGVVSDGRTAPDVVVRDARTIGFDELSAYDRRFFPAERDAFLALWIDLPGRRARMAFRDGRPAGFGVWRPARETARVGPLYADSPETAEALLTSLVQDAEGDPIVLDVPGINPRAVETAERLGLKPCWETARMYTGGTPDIEVSGIYGVTTLELG
jgi:GNAT superfamily N-acetyltransferase